MSSGRTSKLMAEAPPYAFFIINERSPTLHFTVMAYDLGRVDLQIIRPSDLRFLNALNWRRACGVVTDHAADLDHEQRSRAQHLCAMVKLNPQTRDYEMSRERLPAR